MPSDIYFYYNEETSSLSENIHPRSCGKRNSGSKTHPYPECGKITLGAAVSSRFPEIRPRPIKCAKREDENKWNLADSRRHQRDVNKERNSRKLVDTHLSNQELISNIKRSIRQDKMESARMARSVGLTRDAVQLMYYSDPIAGAEDRVIVADKLNYDWKIKNKRFQGKCTYQLKMQASQRSEQGTDAAYTAAKRLFEKEHGRRSRLQKKYASYDTEFGAVKTFAKQHGMRDPLPARNAKQFSSTENGDSINRQRGLPNGHFLPDIDKRARPNLIGKFQQTR